MVVERGSHNDIVHRRIGNWAETQILFEDDPEKIAEKIDSKIKFTERLSELRSGSYHNQGPRQNQEVRKDNSTDSGVVEPQLPLSHQRADTSDPGQTRIDSAHADVPSTKKNEDSP